MDRSASASMTSQLVQQKQKQHHSLQLSLPAAEEDVKLNGEQQVVEAAAAGEVHVHGGSSHHVNRTYISVYNNGEVDHSTTTL